MSENVIIGFPDWTADASWSGGSWETSYPISNVGSDEMAAVARSTDAQTSSTQFTATLSEERLTDLVGVVIPNASIDAKVRFTLRDSGNNQLAKSDWLDFFPATIPTDELLWEDERFWLGKYRNDELTGQLWTRPYQFGQVYLAQDIKVEIDDTGNSDGFVDVSYTAIAHSWQLSINPSPGAQFGFRGARTRGVQSRGGAKNFDRLPKPYTWQGTVEIMERDEALAFGLEHQRQLDIDKPFLWWPYPDEPRHWPRTVMIARTRQISPLRHATSVRDHTELPVDVEQVL